MTATYEQLGHTAAPFGTDLSWDQAVQLDLYYVENRSLGLDPAIVSRTICDVLSGRGAY